MKVIEYIQSNGYTGVLLYWVLAVANMNYTSMLEFVIQSILGGVIWLGFKFLGDHIEKKLKRKSIMKTIRKRKILRATKK